MSGMARGITSIREILADRSDRKSVV